MLAERQAKGAIRWQANGPDEDYVEADGTSSVNTKHKRKESLQAPAGRQASGGGDGKRGRGGARGQRDGRKGGERDGSSRAWRDRGFADVMRFLEAPAGSPFAADRDLVLQAEADEAVEQLLLLGYSPLFHKALDVTWASPNARVSPVVR